MCSYDPGGDRYTDTALTAEVALKSTVENAEMKEARLKRRFLPVEEYLTKSQKRTKLSKHFVSYRDISHLPDLLLYLHNGNKRLTVCKLCLQKNIDQPVTDTASKSGLLNKWEFAMSDSSTTVLNRHMMSVHGIDMSLDTSDVSLLNSPDAISTNMGVMMTSSSTAITPSARSKPDDASSNVVNALEVLCQSSLTSIGRANKKRKSLGQDVEGCAPATPKLGKKMTVDRFFQLESLSRLMDCSNDPAVVQLAKEQLMEIGGIAVPLRQVVVPVPMEPMPIQDLMPMNNSTIPITIPTSAHMAATAQSMDDRTLNC